MYKKHVILLRTTNIHQSKCNNMKKKLTYRQRSRIQVIIKGAVSYQVELGGDVYGNIARINNALGKIDAQLAAYKEKHDNLQQQMDAAKSEINKPFQYENELKEKSAHLAELDSVLNIGAPDPEHTAA